MNYLFILKLGDFYPGSVSQCKSSQNRTRIDPFFGQNVHLIGCASQYSTSVVIL